MSKVAGCPNSGDVPQGKGSLNEPGMQNSRTSSQRLNSLISSTLVLVAPSEVCFLLAAARTLLFALRCAVVGNREVWLRMDAGNSAPRTADMYTT